MTGRDRHPGPNGRRRLSLVWLAMFLLGVPSTIRALAPTNTTSFHLFFLAHEIGRETDTLTRTGDQQIVQSVFHFEDRGTAIDLAATLNLAANGSPRRLVTKGRNYRLFASDAEVTLSVGARTSATSSRRETSRWAGNPSSRSTTTRPLVSRRS